MSAGLKVTRLEHTAAELRRVASRKRDAAQVRRLLALALVLELVLLAQRKRQGQNGMDRQTLRHWVQVLQRFGDRGAEVWIEFRAEASAELCAEGGIAGLGGEGTGSGDGPGGALALCRSARRGEAPLLCDGAI